MNAVPSGKDALSRLASQLKASLRAWRISPHRRRTRRYENVWLLCWLLKDLGWVLLCGVLAWPAALMALALQTIDLIHQWRTVSVGECVHSAAALSWMLGSSMWMTAQLLFEPGTRKHRVAPWYAGALFNPSADAYHFGRFVMQAVNIITLACLAGFYLSKAKGHWFGRFSMKDLIGDNSNHRPTGDLLRQRKASNHFSPAEIAEMGANVKPESLIFGVLTPEVYTKVFIVPLILKDLFWSQQHFIPTIVCMLIVTILMADYFWLFMKWRNLAALLWTTGSAVWISSDLVMLDEEMWPLMLSALFFATGACMLTSAVISGTREADTRHMTPEYDPLL